MGKSVEHFLKGNTPGQVVLGGVSKLDGEVTKSKPVGSVPAWFLLQCLFPDSCLGLPL